MDPPIEQSNEWNQRYQFHQSNYKLPKTPVYKNCDNETKHMYEKSMLNEQNICDDLESKLDFIRTMSHEKENKEVLSSTNEQNFIKEEHFDSKIEQKKTSKGITESAKRYVSRIKMQNLENQRIIDSLLLQHEYYNRVKNTRLNLIKLSKKMNHNKSIWGEGYCGYKNGFTNTSNEIIKPELVKSDYEMNRLIKSSQNKTNELIPIRLNFDLENSDFQLRDAFLLSLNDKTMTIAQVTNTILNDYQISSKNGYNAIYTTIKNQIDEYFAFSETDLKELRVVIKIDVIVGDIHITDQFEWDVLNFESNDPQEFATIFCDEFGLPGEFASVIFFSITEQILKFRKALTCINMDYDKFLLYDKEIQIYKLPSLIPSDNEESEKTFYSVLRSLESTYFYTPKIVKLSETKVKKIEKKLERDIRRKRRQNVFEKDNNNQSANVKAVNLRRSSTYANRNTLSYPDLSENTRVFRTPGFSSVLPYSIYLNVPEIFSYNTIWMDKSTIKNPNYNSEQITSFEEKNSMLNIAYTHDPDREIFLVKIKYNKSKLSNKETIS